MFNHKNGHISHNGVSEYNPIKENIYVIIDKWFIELSKKFKKDEKQSRILKMEYKDLYEYLKGHLL